MQEKILGKKSVSVTKKEALLYIRNNIRARCQGWLMLSPKLLDYKPIFPLRCRIGPDSGAWLRLQLVIKLFQQQKHILPKATK